MSDFANVTYEHPIGRLDEGLILIGGNKFIYDYVGDHIYSSFYKLIAEEDADKFKSLVEKSRESETYVDDCMHILDQYENYRNCVVRIKYNTELTVYDIAFQDVVMNLEYANYMMSKMTLCRDYMTMTGNVFMYYTPEDEMFYLYWLDYEQRIDLCRAPFKEWKKKILKENKVLGKDRTIFETFCDAVMHSKYEQTFRFHGNILNDGPTAEYYYVKIGPCTDKTQECVIGVWTVMNENTQSLVKEDYLENSRLDSMTRLLNKKYIVEYAENAIAAGQQLAIVVMDIDNFKGINDSYGHLFGDQVITAVADVIKKIVGTSGVAGRIGGDEFMVVIEDYGDELGLRNFLRGIKMNVGTLFAEKLNGNKITCSIGVSRNQINADNYNELFLIADRALYLAKQKGKNCYIIYKEEMHGKFVMNAEDAGQLEIRDAFYSDKDLNIFNKRMATFVQEGMDALPPLLEQLAKLLNVMRVVVIMNDDRHIIAGYPDSQAWEEGYNKLFSEEYHSRFTDDMLMLSNINVIEYTIPDLHAFYKERSIHSVMQHYLRNSRDEIVGIVSVEECATVRRFPKLGIQLFQSMSRIIDAVIAKQTLDK